MSSETLIAATTTVLPGSSQPRGGRDLSVDVAKGVAILAVVNIHTVFYTGQFYLPTGRGIEYCWSTCPCFSS